MSQQLLLDTHTLIWALSSPRRLPAPVVKVVRDPETEVYVSSVSTWEIAIKATLGKLDADVATIARAAEDAAFDPLPVTIAHTVRLVGLPAIHRDPFDRLLIAQAIEERLMLATSDPIIRQYPVSVLWD